MEWEKRPGGVYSYSSDEYAEQVTTLYTERRDLVFDTFYTDSPHIDRVHRFKIPVLGAGVLPEISRVCNSISLERYGDPATLEEVSEKILEPEDL